MFNTYIHKMKELPPLEGGSHLAAYRMDEMVHPSGRAWEWWEMRTQHGWLPCRDVNDVHDFVVRRSSDAPEVVRVGESVRLVEAEDAVNSPEHYTHGGIECIDAIKASMSRLEFLGYLKGNCQKYLWRYRHKGNAGQDLAKARWYLERLEQEVGNS